MHIKENPISKSNGFAGFELDASKIKMHSSDNYNILLPYSGPVPDDLQHNNGTFISFNFAVGLKIGICLVVREHKKERRYSIEATAQEINDILFPFFFEDVGGNKYHTRFGNGLNGYWLGNFQAAISTGGGLLSRDTVLRA